MVCLCGAGGSWHTTYTYMPQYVTSHSHGLMLSSLDYTVFDLTVNDTVTIELTGYGIRGQIITGQWYCKTDCYEINIDSWDEMHVGAVYSGTPLNDHPRIKATSVTARHPGPKCVQNNPSIRPPLYNSQNVVPQGWPL